MDGLREVFPLGQPLQARRLSEEVESDGDSL